MSGVKIDRRLNLVVPLDNGGAIHSTPISMDTLAQQWEVIARTHAQLFSSGMSVVNGPRFAALALKGMAEKLGAWEGPGGVQAGLLNEIVRLSNVVRPGADTIPLHTALANGTVTQDEWTEAQGILVFFTLVSSGNARKQVPSILAAAAELWNFQTTLLGLTEWTASVATSSVAGSSGENPA